MTVRETQQHSVRILLIDDHHMVREGLAGMLVTQADFCVVGEAGTGNEGVELARSLRPDIILLDLEMPDLDGIATLEELHTLNIEARVIMLTAYGSDDRILKALRSGAKGCLLKSASLMELLRAVRIVADGGSLIEPGIAERFLRSTQRNPQESLSVREIEILTLIARGLPSKVIGKELHLAERTVKFHITIIFQKLCVANRAEAVAKALHDHLIVP